MHNKNDNSEDESIVNKLEVCDQCDNILDDFAENGTCFECLMNSCIAGNISNGQY
jgi:hypothetical protein